MKLSCYSSCRGLLATALALVTFTAVSAADSFEGRVHMQVTSGKKKEPMNIDYAMKEGKMRMDPKTEDRSGAVGIILDMQTREMFILMDNDGKKMFMRRPMNQGAAHPKDAEREGHPASPPVATGRTETIAGHKATEYRTTTDKGEIVELWLAKGLGPFMSFSGGNPMAGRGATPPGWEAFARDGNYFPMRVVTRDTNGVEQSRMEVTGVEKMRLPDSLFSTEGYDEFQIPGFGGGFNPFKRR
jgi:hypothetical protein